MPLFYWYEFLFDGKVDFRLSFILRNHSELDILVLKFRIVDLEYKVPLVVDGPDAKIEADDIVLVVGYELFVFLLTVNFDFRITRLNRHPRLITQLLYTLTETRNHL